MSETRSVSATMQRPPPPEGASNRKRKVCNSENDNTDNNIAAESSSAVVVDQKVGDDEWVVNEMAPGTVFAIDTGGRKYKPYYVQYMSEVDGFKKILQASGEDSKSPYVWFCVEESREHQRYRHIRCCYNNMYWVARTVNGVCYIFCDATQPVEDLSSPSCTLFSITDLKDSRSISCFAQANDDGNAFKPQDYNDGYLIKQFEGKTSYNWPIMFEVTKKEPDQPQLPMHVCFKGDNGKYLSGQSGSNYLKFWSNDIGDPTVKHTIYSNPKEGTIRIWSDYLGKFWNGFSSSNWILADTSSGYEYAKEVKFRVVKLGDNKFALKNIGKNMFCKRMSNTGNNNTEDCLSASVESITSDAQLTIEEAVLSRKIYGAEYHLEDAKMYNHKALIMASSHAVNRSSKDNTAKMTIKYGSTRQSSWNATVSLKLGVKITVEIGVPLISSGKVETQLEFSGSYQWGSTVTSSEEHSVDYDITVPPNKAVKLSVLATQATCDVPFSYYQEDVLTDGTTRVSKLNDGIYRGINSYDFTYDVKEEPLTADSLIRYKDFLST
uniref:Agglutinin domain-containing protein n=1 Tax=Leersia perrieri TaxID=77586 RepID=A0A0D9XHI4_9ORYZ